MQVATPVTHLVVGKFCLTTDAKPRLPALVRAFEENNPGVHDVVQRNCLAEKRNSALCFEKHTATLFQLIGDDPEPIQCEASLGWTSGFIRVAIAHHDRIGGEPDAISLVYKN